ncbi:MAG: hypothetical protein KC493_02705 [Bacteriovoracaceae bacterium]|nr:hypothetical protein [Bacteriovoracaceae bacterium]
MYLKLLSFILMFSMAFKVYASKPAVVVSTRAVIYADQELKSPIGFVSAGRKVIVGDVPRKNGEILPIIVIGRVAWIKVRDLALNTEDLKNITTSRFKVSQDQFEKNKDKFDDNVFENNYARLVFGSISVDDSYKEFAELTGSSPGDTATNFKVNVFHRPPFKRSIWSIGFAYYTQSETDYDWETITLEATYGYSLIQTSAFSIDAYGGFLVGGDFNYSRLESGQTVKDNGSTYGWLYGAQIKLFSYSKIGLIAGFTRQTLKLSGLTAFETTSGGKSDLQEISGTNIFFGLSFKL